MLPIRSTNDLLLEIETPNLRVTFKDFAIAEDREKAGGQYAKINSGKFPELQKYLLNGTNFME